MFSAYICDFDGTLVDTFPANVLSYEKAFKKVGIPFDDYLYRKHFGHRFDEMIKILAPNVSIEVCTKIQNYKKEFYATHYELVKVNSALVALLETLKMHSPVCLATTASKKNAQPLLNHLSLLPLFSQILYGEDVVSGKPDPECYNTLIKLMGVNPEECLVFEDSEIGIKAAKLAGAQVLKIKL